MKNRYLVVFLVQIPQVGILKEDYNRVSGMMLNLADHFNNVTNSAFLKEDKVFTCADYEICDEKIQLVSGSFQLFANFTNRAKVSSYVREVCKVLDSFGLIAKVHCTMYFGEGRRGGVS